ncbi:MAG: hypothetical protein Q9209_002483 [Squamulea sp. 1 TL-2023]
MAFQLFRNFVSKDPEVTPGGRIGPPQLSKVPLIDVSIRPRLSLYLDGESTGSFIVDATVGAPVDSYFIDAYDILKASSIHGQPWDADLSLSDQSKFNAGTVDSIKGNNNETLTVTILHVESGAELLPRTTIKYNETGKEFVFLTETLKASQAPQSIKLKLTHADGRRFEATTSLYYLPKPGYNQSITRIDSLYGGLQVRTSNLLWQKIFPYSFYLSGAWLASDPANLKRFCDLGFNILHIIPGGEGIGYDLNQLDAWFDEAEKLGLWIMYDMRWTYRNSGYVKTQVERYRTRRNMLLYYTADEPGRLTPHSPRTNMVVLTPRIPDGHEDDPSAPSKSYAFIKSLDPYHPVSLCLNCQNYHFQEYSAGGDIILADVYPIGTNTSYSTKYQTPCNETYGDCGCDNCITSPTSPALMNIPSRLHLWSSFRDQLGLPHKSIWFVPQAFTQQDFWTRTPSPREVIAMILLSLNHGAKGIVMWVFPTADEIIEAASRFSKAVLSPYGILDTSVTSTEAVRVSVTGARYVDAAMWRAGSYMTVNAVNAGEERIEGEVRLEFGEDVKIKSLRSIRWGSPGWRVEGQRVVVRNGMDGLATWVTVIDIDENHKGIANS